MAGKNSSTSISMTLEVVGAHIAPSCLSLSFSLSLSLSRSLFLSSSAGHGRRAKPPGHMGPPSVMGLSAGRDDSSISPNNAMQVDWTIELPGSSNLKDTCIAGGAAQSELKT